MPYTNNLISTIYASPSDKKENERVHACNRLLLYMHSLDMRALPSLELAMESMRRAGGEAGLEAIMDEMHTQLREHGVELQIRDSQGRLLRSAAPMNRRSMLSGDVSRNSLYKWMRTVIGKTGA